ncbi:hypothetical protein ElyMa_002613600 [Elysia marginata]|uniref:Uncharacterized protein n=1 Tax=Elysia marginata TaxID=1093978 RepID=A0AAV4H256_9GAST|nr:hypothetical protein ElyMa_002613600 [Elysia marginata]
MKQQHLRQLSERPLTHVLRYSSNNSSCNSSSCWESPGGSAAVIKLEGDKSQTTLSRSLSTETFFVFLWLEKQLGPHKDDKVSRLKFNEQTRYINRMDRERAHVGE